MGLKERGANKQLWLYILAVILLAQLPSIFIFAQVSKMQKAIKHYDEILALETADNADIEFIAQLKRELGLSQDVQILIGPYKKVYGNTFKYRSERHLAFVEQSLTTKETFLILFDKMFYHELDWEQRRAVLAHEMWHVSGLASGTTKPDLNEELNADNYASRKVRPKILIDLYNQYEGDGRRKEAKINNLERQILSRSTGG